MTLQKLILRIRTLGENWGKNENYLSEEAFFFYRPEGGGNVQVSGLSNQVGDAIIEAYRGGVFTDRLFDGIRTDLRRAAGRNRSTEALETVLFWLEEQGFRVMGADKENDPFERLAGALEEVQHRGRAPGGAMSSSKDRKYAVALSFAGEKRKFVGAVAKALAKRISPEEVFFDSHFQEDLARPNLDTFLQDIYHNRSELVVLVICKAYEHKEWCGLEMRAIRDLIKKRREDDIMIFRFDDAEIPGIFSTDGYLNAKDMTPARAAELIHKRLLSNRGCRLSPTTSKGATRTKRGGTAFKLIRNYLDLLSTYEAHLEEMAEVTAPHRTPGGGLVFSPGEIEGFTSWNKHWHEQVESLQEKLAAKGAQVARLARDCGVAASIFQIMNPAIKSERDEARLRAMKLADSVESK